MAGGYNFLNEQSLAKSAFNVEKSIEKQSFSIECFKLHGVLAPSCKNFRCFKKGWVGGWVEVM